MEVNWSQGFFGARLLGDPDGIAQKVSSTWLHSSGRKSTCIFYTQSMVHPQACRGDKHDDPVTPAAFDDVDSELKKNEVEVDASAVYTLPAGADFIMCYSVAEGEMLDC